MEAKDFLLYALRLSVHAATRYKRISRCGIDLFHALLTEPLDDNARGVTYWPEQAALQVTSRKDLDHFVIDVMKKKRYGQSQRFDRDREFMTAMIKLAADETLKNWFAGRVTLPFGRAERQRAGLTKEDAMALGLDQPTACQGVLLTCYGQGSLWFAISNDPDFVQAFHDEAEWCVDHKNYRMPGFKAEQQFAMLKLDGGPTDPHLKARRAAKFLEREPNASAVWHTFEDHQALNDIVHYLLTVPRRSEESDSHADYAEVLIVKLQVSYAVGPAVHLREELRDVTMAGRQAAIEHIIAIRKPLPGETAEEEALRLRPHRLIDPLPAGKHFRLANGKRVKSILELATTLDTIDDEVLAQHLQRDKNDLRSWVDNIVGDERLSQAIADLTDKKALQLILLKHIRGRKYS